MDTMERRMSFEKIDMPLETELTEDDLIKSDYAQVIFHNIAETYPIEAHIECRYTITPRLLPSSRDWVGLYKVGWSSSKEYVCFDWASTPADYEEGKEVQAGILFQAHTLPSDDGEFYQFCYVTRAGQVRGASTPFQFKHQSLDDFVEIEDKDTDMMVIKSRTMALEEDLQQAVEEKQALEKNKELLETERESLLKKLMDLNQRLSAEQQSTSSLKTELAEAEDKIDTLNCEAKDMVILHDALRDKVAIFSKEKDEILKRLDENELYIKQQQEKIKVLANEKDALVGKQRMLEEEKELFKTHFTTSESTVQGYMMEVSNLKKQLAMQEELYVKTQEELAHIRTDLDTEKKRTGEQQRKGKTDQEQINDLLERLKNTEDKLMAAEHCKTMLNDEAKALHDAHDKMSETLEDSKSESHSLKIHLAKIEENSKKEEGKLREEIDVLVTSLQQVTQEKEELLSETASLKEQIKQLETKTSVDAEAHGSLYAARSALSHIEKKCLRLKKQLKEAVQEKELLYKQQKLQHEIGSDLKREVADLKERLIMAAEEYKTKYVECRKWQTEAKRSQKQMRKLGVATPEQRVSLTESESAAAAAAASSTAHGTTQTSPEETGESATNTETAQVDKKESCTQVVTSELSSELSAAEVQAQLSELARELEQRGNKKHKYKQLYLDEKEKCSFLQRHYFDEVKKYQEELEKLKHSMEYVKTEEACRVKGLQLIIEQQQQELEQLRLECGGSTGAKKRPSKETATSECKMFAGFPTMYRNPYVPHPPSQPTTQRSTPPTPPSSPHVTPSPPPAGPVNLHNFVAPLPANLPFPKFAENTTKDEEEEEGAEKDEGSVEDNLTNADTPKTLDTPLTPLPPPIQPEVLPSAKVAAVKALSYGAHLATEMSIDGATDYRMGEETQRKRPGRAQAGNVAGAGGTVGGAPRAVSPSPVPDSVDGDEERFLDADGDPQKLCPVCAITFPAETPQSYFEEHVKNHFGLVCPMCEKPFDQDVPTEEFETHVQAHFANE